MILSNLCFSGHVVAQLRVIFQPVMRREAQAEFLAYVEPLIPTSVVAREDGEMEGARDPNSGLIEVKRLYKPDLSRFGMVIKLTDIWRSVDLVPVYGRRCPEWTGETAYAEAQSFWINIYSDKETFQSLTV